MTTNISTKKLLAILSTSLFAVTAWVCWAFVYPYLLAFQEQLQLFLFDMEYFTERISEPGGLARYIGEFFVQMYNSAMLGAAVIAALYVIMQQLMWRLIRYRCNSGIIGYTVSFIPSLMVWFDMGDEKTKLTFVIAMLMAIIAMVLYPASKKRTVQYVYLAFVIPLLSWFAGPAALMLACYVLTLNIVKPFNVIGIASVIYTLACLLIPGQFVAVPTYRLIYGIHYSLVTEEFPVVQYVTMMVSAILPVAMLLVPEIKKLRTEIMISLSAAAASIILCIFIFSNSFVTVNYDVLKYDAMVRAQKWDEIIATAEKKIPQTPLTVASLNLALAMKGQLTERGMTFYQNGWRGAFPPFTREMMASIISAEVYFYTGLVNTAQRMDFEGMEALPDKAKSARVIKRLAETNLINGQYDVARKYLQLLEKTMFYSKWAQRTECLLDDEEAISNHPLYGYMRKVRLTDDFLFSDIEIDKIMGQLLMCNKENAVAAQYLLFLPQLEGNQQKYLMYLDFLKKQMKQD